MHSSASGVKAHTSAVVLTLASFLLPGLSACGNNNQQVEPVVIKDANGNETTVLTFENSSKSQREQRLKDLSTPESAGQFYFSFKEIKDLNKLKDGQVITTIHQEIKPDNEYRKKIAIETLREFLYTNCEIQIVKQDEDGIHLMVPCEAEKKPDPFKNIKQKVSNNPVQM